MMGKNMDNSAMILQIALPTPLRRTFDYYPPHHANPCDLKPGMRLKVPFGKRESIGVLLKLETDSDVSPDKLKSALEIIDEYPMLTPSILELFNFASHYYQHSIGEIIFSSLPPLLRNGEQVSLPQEHLFSLTELGATNNDVALQRATQQIKLIQILKEHPNGLTRQQMMDAGGQAKALTALLAKGFIKKNIRENSVVRAHNSTRLGLALNQHQQQAVTAIIQQQGFATYLLEGVTGSGKTEVYLHIIEHILKQNKQALVLVPEIGLTPQTVARFQARFAVPISILHSGLNDRERTLAWLAAQRGIARIIIGTRSAVLTPLPELGVIILDEEHDSSFKQQSGFRYSAKDLAIMRGKLESVSVILGSATPCLETFYNAKQKRFQHLRLPNRAGSATQPQFHILDIRSKKLEQGLSPLLLQNMQKHIANDGQVLLFLNRRGFAPTILCHHCGWTAHCSRCDAKFTYHQYLEQLICHHCGTNHKLFQRCAACHSSQLLLLGLGTERLEKILQQYFPDISISRIDRDSTRRKGAMEKMLANIQSGENRILIGTQMLAKGHHFPDVTMVAIVDVDNCLYSSDFRASERLGQTIIQVAGRAGRSDKPGEVYIQTHNPEHPLLVQLIKSGYTSFAESLLKERRSANLPPFSYLALFRAEATQVESPINFLTEVRSLLTQSNSKFQIFGPIPALMERKAGRYRAQLLIQTDHRGSLQKTLHPALQAIESLPLSRKVRWSLDIDPLEIF
jgi:primosomal protein N' (replication factor Y) (superfamily II helicase)